MNIIFFLLQMAVWSTNSLRDENARVEAVTCLMKTREAIRGGKAQGGDRMTKLRKYRGNVIEWPILCRLVWDQVFKYASCEGHDNNT